MIRNTFQTSLSLIPTDWLRLRVAQVPRCRDLAIFGVTTDVQTDRQTDYLTPAHTRRVKTMCRSAVGTVNECIYKGQQTASICDAHGP